jgi:hypothetical protein
MSKIFIKIINCFSILLLLSACADPVPIKNHPEHVGVDPHVQSLVDEYVWLSKQNHIEFDQQVTIGFKEIDQGAVVGECTVAPTFREIDLDITYWNNTTNTTHLAVLFHELTHCYCLRMHDYGKDLPYPESSADRVKVALEWRLHGGPRPGYWDDGCPASLMHPSVVDDDCVKAHYDQYVQEMFDRCEPF